MIHSFLVGSLFIIPVFALEAIPKPEEIILETALVPALVPPFNIPPIPDFENN